MSVEATGLEAEIERLKEEIAARRAEAAGISSSLDTHQRTLAGLAERTSPTTGEAPPPGVAVAEASRETGLATAPAETTETDVSTAPAETIPAGRVLVPWGGYEAVDRLDHCEALRFPPPLDDDPGTHARGGTAAIASLEAMRAGGATHLVLPPDRQEWLESTPGFMAHVTNRYTRVAAEDQWAVYGLDFDPADQRPWTHHLDELFEVYRGRYEGEPATLDWDSELGLAGRRWRGCTVFRPNAEGDSLPYLTGSVEIVVLGKEPTPERLAEARRVASNAIIRRADPYGPRDYFEVEWLSEPSRRLPPISIIIPTYNAAPILDTCLRSLAETLSAALPVEVVVVDDASTDATDEVVDRWRSRVAWLRAIRNDDNSGFLASCNAGAAAASGEILVFLNNDTIALPRWLSPLVETLVDEPDAGVVGGKLVYPDGTLQEAGGVIFSDASGANLGRGDRDPDAPLYCYLRDVHYCSGALIATHAELFRGLGGFDPHFSPGYYEETDYCFRARREGARTLFEPESAIVHLEGATAGTDLASGMKRYQVVNRDKFRQRWAAELASCPAPLERLDQYVWHRLARVRPAVAG